MSLTITITDVQLAKVGAVSFTDHERMILGRMILREIHSYHASACEPNNYLWNNSEGAGAAWRRILKKVNPDYWADNTQLLGSAYTWRQRSGQGNGVAT